MSDQTANAVFDSRLVVRATLRTDVGKVRSENQDFGTLTSDEESSHSQPGGRLLVVADGMGGHRGGATASRLAGETVKAKYLDSATDDIAAALRDALSIANRRIYSEAQANPDLRGMGTTTSALAVRDGKGWFAHVGDSRIYLVRHGEIKQLTDDHSLVATMMREGLLTAKEAENHPRRNVLQRSVGVGEDVEIDVRGPFELRDGDMFILCSDGLHGLVKEDEMREVAQLDIDAAADEFLKRALDRGAPDNVTVIVARVERADGVAPATLAGNAPVARPADMIGFDETISDDTVREIRVPPVAAADAAKVITDKIPALSAETLTASPGPTGDTPVAPLSPKTTEVPAPPLAKTAEVPVMFGDATLKTTESPLPRSAKTTEVPMDDATVRIAPAAAASLKTAEVAAPTLPGTAVVPPPRSGSSVLKWTLIFVLVLGAAGAVFIWSQQPSNPSTTTSSPKK
jgi:protein phosphatase